MADDTEDLGFSVGADTAGLDDAERRTIAFLDRFTQTVTQATHALPALDINTAPVEGSLGRARDAFQRFIREARDLSAVPFLNTAAAKQELQELIAEFPGLTAALKHIDPTGILQRTAQQAQEATQAILAAQQAVVATPPARPVGAGGGTVRGDETQQLRLLAAMTEEEERHARALGATTQATTGLAAAETQLAATMAQQAIAALRAGAASQVQAEQAARAQDRVNQAQRLAQASAEIPPQARQFSRGNFDVLASGLQGQRTAADEARAANERLRETMLQQGQAARRVGGDNEAAAAAMGAIGRQSGRITEGANGANAGVSRLRGGLTALAVTASGANPAIGSVVSGLLLMGAGSTVVLGVAAGVAAIGLAYDHLTENSRHAREEHEKLLDELRRRVTGPDETGPAAENAAAQKSIGDAMRERQRLQDEINGGGLDNLNILVRQQAIEAQLRKETEARTLAAATNAEATASITQDSSAGTALVRSLAIQVASFGQNEFAAKRLAVAMDTTLTPAQRTAATALLRTLEGYDAQKRAAEDAARAAQRDGAAIRDSFEDAIRVVDEAIAKLGQNRFGELIARQRKDARSGAGLGLLPAADTGISAGFDQAQASVRGIETALEDAAVASDRFFAKALRDAEDTRDANERLADSIHEITRFLDDVAGAAVGMGLIGDEAARSIGSVLNLADALGEVAKSASTGNILGAIGAGLGFVGSLVGPDRGTLELQRAQRENTEALRQATEAYRATQERFAGLGGLDEQRTAVARIGAIVEPSGVPGTGIESGAAGPSLATKILEDAARAAGISLQDLNDIAKQNGIQLLSDSGKFIAGSFDALKEKINQAAAAAEQFAITFGEQVQRATLESRLAGRTQDPGEIFAEQLQGLRGVGADAIANLFNDPGNVDAVRREALNLLHQIEAGTLPLAQLGSLSIEDLRAFLDSTADFADALQQAADAANSFASQFNEISLRSRLAGEPQDAASQFDRQIMAAASVVGDSSRDFQRQLLGLLPLEGDALREALLKLFDSFQAEGLDLGNLTPEEFFALLGSGADALDAFNDSVADATKSLQGVPDFFKLGEAEFAARAIGNDGAVLPIPFTPVNLTTRQATSAETQLPASVTQSTDRRTAIYVTGPITLVFKEPPKNAEELRRAVKTGAMRASLAETGREDDVHV